MKNDLISRAALISAFLNRQRSETEVKYHLVPGEEVLNMIQNAPAVEPEKAPRRDGKKTKREAET